MFRNVREAAVFTALVLPLLFALWLLLVMNTNLSECLLGGVCAGVALVGTAAFGRTARIRFNFDWRLVLEGCRMPWYCVSGSWALLEALAKQLFGRRGADNYLATLRCEACRGTARDAARRALLTAYTTSTPNFVVIGVMRQKALVIFHKVHRDKIVPMVRNLGGAPFPKAQQRGREP